MCIKYEKGEGTIWLQSLLKERLLLENLNWREMAFYQFSKRSKWIWTTLSGSDSILYRRNVIGVYRTHKRTWGVNLFYWSLKYNEGMHRKVKVFLFGNPWILCHEIYQNSNSKIELNIKMTTQNDNTRCKQHRKYKRRHGWTNLHRIETDCNCGFHKLVSLTVFQNSFVVWNVWNNYILRGHICLTQSCDFVIHKQFLNFIANKDVLLAS